MRALTAFDRPATFGRGSRALLLAVLAIAIVGAQILGFAHRVAHGEGWPQRLALAHEHDGHEAGTDYRLDAAHAHDDHAAHAHDGPADHNCAAVDALTLGNVLMPVAVAAALIATAAEETAVVAERQGGRFAASPFQARAPPAFS
jgi:hypothetical protein